MEAMRVPVVVGELQEPLAVGLVAAEEEPGVCAVGAEAVQCVGEVVQRVVVPEEERLLDKEGEVAEEDHDAVPASDFHQQLWKRGEGSRAYLL